MKKSLPNFKTFMFLNFGILIMAISTYFFKTPNGFATGGVSGISIILYNIFRNVAPVMTPAVYMMIINVFLLIIGIIILGKECGWLTAYCSIMLSLETWIFERIFNLSVPMTSYPLLELVYAILLSGIGSAIIFNCKASSGGTDIAALILKKYTSMNVGTALLCTDFLIAAATFAKFSEDGSVSFDAQTGLFSMLGLFAKVFVIDDIIDSMNLCKAFTIITTKPEEINRYITEDIHHSATVYAAKGAYTGDDRMVIMTVCRKSEAIKLRRRVLSIDPHAFIIVTKSSEIMGKGFTDTIN